MSASLVHAPKWKPATLYAPPWYRDADGVNASYDTVGAKPWRYDELIANREPQPFDYKPTSEELAKAAVTNGAKVLSLEVGPDVHLVLDGNHRLMLRLGQLAFKDVAMPWYRIHAPESSSLAPDTIHFPR